MVKANPTKAWLFVTKSGRMLPETLSTSKTYCRYNAAYYFSGLYAWSSPDANDYGYTGRLSDGTILKRALARGYRMVRVLIREI